MRCFIAIKFDPGEMIINMMEDLKNNFKVKLVERENIHATIKFLGEIDEKMLDMIIKKMEEIKFSRFSAKLTGMGAFPNERRARVIWIGIKSDEFLQLGNRINDILKNIGENNFSPHLTVARLKESSDVSDFIKNYRNTFFGEYDISSFSLFKSTLTPAGPIYTELKRFKAEN